MGVTTVTTPPMSLRTAADEIAYQTAKATGQTRPLEEEPTIKEWKYFRLIKNRFPYTIAYKEHHMIVPKRKVCDLAELSLAEFQELLTLLAGEINDKYDLWFVNTTKRRSVHDLFHIHVASFVSDRKEIRL